MRWPFKKYEATVTKEDVRRAVTNLVEATELLKEETLRLRVAQQAAKVKAGK